MIQDEIIKAIFNFAITGLTPKIVLLNKKDYDQFMLEFNPIYQNGPESWIGSYIDRYSVGGYTVKLIETDVNQVEVYGTNK